MIEWLSWFAILCFSIATYDCGTTCRGKVLIVVFWVFLQLLFDFFLVKLKHKKRCTNYQFNKRNIRTINSLFALDAVSTIEMGMLFYLREKDYFCFWLIGLIIYVSIAKIITLYIDKNIDDYLEPIKFNVYLPKK